MPHNDYESESATSYRNALRKKLVDMFLTDYGLRRDRGELLYAGKWITPEKKYDFMNDLKEDHKHLVQDSVLGLIMGFVGAVILVLLLKLFMFPS